MFNRGIPNHEEYQEAISHDMNGPAHPRTVELCVTKMRTQSQEYGRNYLNMVHRRLVDEDDTFQSRLMEYNEDSMWFLREPSLEEEIERFNVFKDSHSQMRVFAFSFHLDSIKQSCIEKRELAQKFGTVDVDQKKDWFEWNAYIIEVCENMNKEYPKYFCQGLKATLNHVQADLLRPANAIYPYPVQAITHHTEYDEMDWEIIREMLHGFKMNASCGFLFGVLNQWLIEATSGMRRQMQEFGQFLCPIWAESQKPKFYPKPKALPQGLDSLNTSINEQEENKRNDTFFKKNPVANLPNRYNAFSNGKTSSIIFPIKPNTVFSFHPTHHSSLSTPNCTIFIDIMVHGSP